MKRIYTLLLFSMVCISMVAQETYFQDNGIWFRILQAGAAEKSYDASHNEVAVTQKQPATSSYYSGTVEVPATVTYNGTTYTVTYIDDYAFSNEVQNGIVIDSLSLPSTILKSGGRILESAKIGKFCTPENLKEIPDYFLWGSKIEEIWLSPNIVKVGDYALNAVEGLKRVHGFSKTKIEELGLGCLRGYTNIGVYGSNLDGDKIAYIKDMATLPPTIRNIGDAVFIGAQATQAQLPLENFMVPNTIENIGGYNFEISGKVTVPHLNPFTLGENAFGTTSTLKIQVPIDRSFAFKTVYAWSSYADKIIEDIKIGSTGYTTYYLNNENFLVPAGCTAYIITGVTPSGNQALPDQAIVKAFGAGKIIPKQTGFVLQGPANSTVTYQANVTGAEEDVTGNLLVGTATGEEFSTTGKRYYVLAAGSQGMGFYKQGIREGKSINLPAHRAGLCLDASIARAKGLIIDFDAAREATGISSVNSDVQKKEDVIYDLQGRRVAHPSHGIYIINGKKVVK